MVTAILAVSLFPYPSASSTPTTTGFGFNLQGAAVNANCFISSARSYYPNGWQLLKDAGVNWIRVSGGIEGDINHFNIQNYPNEWAQNLDNFLAQADSHGIKVSFGSLGSAYGTLFGIRSPGIIGSEARDTNPKEYTPIEQAEAIIDKLAGDNSLHHNFIADPRVLGWVTSNEVYIGPNTDATNRNHDGPFILQWNLRLLDYIHSKGGKAWMASPTTIEGSSAGYNFALTLPLIGEHVDFLEAHYYEEATLVSNYVKTDGSYDWVSFENYYRNSLTRKMVNAKGDFPIENVLLGEFGMWVGNGNDFGLSVSFTTQDRVNYYNAVLNAARDAGIKNLCQFDFFEQYQADINDYSIVNFKTKSFFSGDAADVLLGAYGSCSIALSLDSSTVNAGSSVGINGQIFPGSIGVPVSVSMRRLGGEWDTLALVTTDSAGAVSYVWSGIEAGAYEIKASFIANGVTQIESSIALLNVNAIASAISVNVNASTATVGDKLHVSGAIVPVRGDALVTLSRSSKGTGWTTLALVTTDSSGHFSYLWSGITEGTFLIKASWQGDPLTTSAESQSISVTANLLSSSVSVQVESSSVLEGLDVQVKGQVPSQTGVNVSVLGRISGGEAAWITLETVQTDSSGYFSYVWSGLAAGSYEVKASWLGNAVTAGAESNVAVFFVYSNQPVTTASPTQTSTPPATPASPAPTTTTAPTNSPDISSPTPTTSPTTMPTPTVTPDTSPSTSLSLDGKSGDNGWFLSDVTVTLTVETQTPQTCTINYSFDNVTWSNYTAPFNITQSGVNTLYFKATDEGGEEEAPKMATIKIDKEAPQAVAIGDATADAYVEVTFSGVGSGDDVAVVSYQWDFGDGNSAVGQNCTHVYSAAGAYVVRLTAKDAVGRRGTDSLFIQVNQTANGGSPSFPWSTEVGLITVIAVAGLVTAGFIAKRKKWSLPKIFSANRKKTTEQPESI
ncbi:MAG: PKD domain-containing protein [Candidatus Bathyarchaeota archaeon]|nr:PKD domain-containing protein [Candidatus Bathyarchaeota archaeon]